MNSHGVSRPEVSILVPVYNVEGYLAECLDSILQQPGVDLEVVCIDDCGADRSCEIVKEYQTQDPRVRMISHSENRGLSAARNTGIENAEGEYVLFLDSDDLLNPDILALQVAAIRRDQADMVYFHTDLLWERFPGDPSPAISSNPPEFVLFNQELRRTNLLNYPALLHAASSWSYIYSVDFLRRHNIRFDEHLKRWEDRAFWTRVARLADSVSIVPVSARKYRQRAESITKGLQDPEHLQMMLLQLNIVLDEFELFRTAHAESDTRIHTTYLHSYVAFRIATWFLNAVKKMEDEQCREALLKGAVELFKRLDWSRVDLCAVEHFTRRLQVDVPRTALLCGLLRKGKIAQVMRFFAFDRLPSRDLLEVEDVFDGAYPIPRERFEEREYGSPASEGAESGRAAPEPWMNEISLVIHIGFRKTGTTYIQNAFDLNRDLLLRDGVLFPNAGLDRTSHRGGRPGACAGHLGFVELVRNRERRWDLWQEIRREIGEHKVGTIFISAENFLHEYQRVNLNEFRKTFSGFKQVTFIVSLRRPDRWIESLYKEVVAGGWKGETRAFDTFINEEWSRMDYANRLAPWTHEFGIETFDALSVDSHKDEMDGVKAVLGILRKRTGAGPDPDGISGWSTPSGVDAYPSPKAELVEAIRLLNMTKKPSAAYRREVLWLIKRWNGADGLHDEPLMDERMRARIRNEVGPEYAGLLRRFGLEDHVFSTVPHATAPPEQVLPAMPPRVSSLVMEDVMRVSRKLPNQDPVHSFFRRLYSRDLPKTGKTEEPRISATERLISMLILKPVLAVWNKASRDTRESLRKRAKSAFGNGYVDRIVQLARKTSGPAPGKRSSE